MAFDTSAYNTPQAQDDIYSVTEAQAEAAFNLILWLDVMANDLGGKSKTLWSIDNADDLADLFQKDAQISFESSALGAMIYIKDGKVAYDLTPIADLVDSLSQGEALTDTLTYAIRLGNGTLSFGEVNITFRGANDAVTIQPNISTANIAEDSTDPVLSADGVIAFGDADLNDTHSADVVPNAGNSLGGTLVASVVTDTTGVGQGTIAWTYQLDNSAAQYLAAGETVTEYFTVTVLDTNGSSVAQQVAVTITGTDDLSVISGTSTGSVTEDAAIPTVRGKLDAFDVDGADDNFVAATGHGGYGNYTVDATGHWSYTLNNANPALSALNTGDSLVDSFTVFTADGVSQQVSIVIDGHTDFLPAVYNGADPNDFDARLGIGSTVINGTDGSDTFDQPTTNASDVINGMAGDDRFFTYGGADTVYAGSGNDLVEAGGGVDVVYAQAGEDEVYGANNPDSLYGGSGNDIINGGAGDDIIFGGSGDDIIIGQGGDDFIVGGYGADTFFATLTSNHDTFVYLDVRDTGDTFNDFRAIFTLDFSAIDADTNTAGNQAFLWGGETATAYGIWTSLTSDGSGHLYLDTDGDVSTAELALTFLATGGSSLPVPQQDTIIL